MNDSDITNCYSFGKITNNNGTDPAGIRFIGGICGYSASRISSCYSACEVAEASDSGAIAGYCNNPDSKNNYYNIDICRLKGMGGSGEAIGLTTLRMTASDALDTMEFPSDIWHKTDNDKIGKKAYYPGLNGMSTDPYVGYETKISIAPVGGSTMVRGEDIRFDVSAQLKFDGMDDYITVEDSENVNVATFRLKCNDKYITNIMELPDYSVKQIDCTNSDIPAGEQNIIMEYKAADRADYFADDTATVTVNVTGKEEEKDIDEEQYVTIVDEDKPSAPTADIPKTGDERNMKLWLVLLVISAGGMGAAFGIRNKRKA